VKRFVRLLGLLLPSGRTLGLLLLLWTLASNVSTAQFVIEFLRGTTKWLDHHAWAGFIGGFALLSGSIAWPDIRRAFAGKLSLPKTTTERIDSLEEAINRHLDLQSELARITGESLKDLGQDRIKATEERSDLRVKLIELEGASRQDLKSEINSVRLEMAEKLGEYNLWIRELENRIMALEAESSRKAQ
jgi:hypothetical protein